MYGLVNRALQEMVSHYYSDNTWTAITDRAGIDEQHFVSLEAYPDEITYKLVGAASEELGLAPNEVLERFGEYWVLFTGRSAFGTLMNAAGNNLAEFVRNLDSLHMRLGVTMPHLKPPSFRCFEEKDGRLRVNYYSDRQGLAPMVVGLLRGLGKMFGECIEVTHSGRRSVDLNHDEFTISFLK